MQYHKEDNTWELYNIHNKDLHTHSRHKRVLVKIKKDIERHRIPNTDNMRTLESYTRVTTNRRYLRQIHKIIEEVKRMNFGQAIEKVKQGKKVFRLNWNGKGMFVVYQKGYPDGIPCNLQTAKAWGLNEGDLFKCEPYLQIKMANGSHAMWVPSINDVLAEDWQVIN